MKTIRIFSVIVVLICLLASCQRDETLNINSTDCITFKVSGEALSAEGVLTKGSCDSLTYEISDWEYTPEGLSSGQETKATLTQTLEGETGVFGYNFESDISEPNVMHNAKFTIDGYEITSEQLVLWKDLDQENALFYAYSPYGKFEVSDESVSGVPYLTYTVPADHSKQIDILCGQSDTIPTSSRPPVELEYRHALTAVQFRLGIDDATLKKVTLKNIKSSGKLFLDRTWSDQSDAVDYNVTSTNDILLMVPQTLSDDAEIILEYTKGGKDITIKAGMKGQIWPAGKKVVYTLGNKNDPIQYIYFDLALGNVVLKSDTYSGYINVMGTGSTNIKEVTGTHSDNNRYYIYCSVYGHDGDGNCSQVWSKVTGYKNETDYNNRLTKGVTPVIPLYDSYIETKSTGAYVSDWGKFITNNQSPYNVREAWDNGDQNYSTTNIIYICGPESGYSVFDVTLDRVFSRYENNKKGSLTIGHDGSEWKNYFTEKVILRLKNNNALNRIHYRKPYDSTKEGYLKITSADGDGVAKGTLTVTLSRKSESAEPSTLVYSLIGAGIDNGTQYGDERGQRDRQVKNLEFNGGIVYVGTQKYNNSHWSSLNALLGVIGGINSFSEVTINGGILTAVSNNTSPAIGGGGGWESTGGKGIVTINGGTVYAYSFGVLGTFDGQNTIVIPPAIGGGGTLGEEVDSTGTFIPANAGPCEVTINGGNVYAYAVGGPAIGGGSCGRHAAGKCEFTMKGGNVVAQSLAGTIGGMDVSATNAIGGGRSGLVDGDGGTAVLKLEGGNLHTGSVGGGTVDPRNPSGKIGSAEIKISGGQATAQFIMAKGSGVAPSFTMTGGVIRNSNASDAEYYNVQPNGGAVYMEEGTCSITGGTISKCKGTLGGAIYMDGGTFTMSGGEISSCTAVNHGGAVYIKGGGATVSGGTITKNIAAKGNGGGIYVSGGNFTMPKKGKGTITHNTADADMENYTDGDGGGIYVRSTDKDVDVDILGGKVQYNAADRNGGGLCVDMKDSENKATVTIGTDGGIYTDPDIQYNSASLSGGGMSVLGIGSNITIYSGTIKGNVSAYVKNEDIRNDGGQVDLRGKNEEGKTPQVDVKYNTIRFYANNGEDPEPYDDQRVITSTNSPLRPTAKALSFELEFYHIASWNTRRDGTGTAYAVDGGGKLMNLTEDLSLYAQWAANK